MYATWCPSFKTVFQSGEKSLSLLVIKLLEVQLSKSNFSRFREIHIINESYMFDIIYALVRLNFNVYF